MTEERKLSVQNRGQVLCLENREKFSVSGVENVETFSETLAVLDTCFGRLSLKGEGLKLQKLDVESGVLTAEGKFTVLEYSKKQEKHSFFERVFR
ncbi:MAG: sporulation protein YabP [Ruminococcaceae bacterium]|nr:sporulation protein YabP [Oscillospiraceae bacterium]